MVYQLNTSSVFPDPSYANGEGLLAIGGDLSPERLLSAYSNGIFPWPHGKEYPLLWFSPDPRTVLLPADFHISRSLKKLLKKCPFEVRFDTAFEQVMQACAAIKRKDEADTWITTEMTEAYTGLHHLGFAHSVECWREGVLRGGLHGISLGAAFFGESLFSYEDNASKVALTALLQQLDAWEFHFVDCQMRTNLVVQFGALEWKRVHFIEMLNKALQLPTRRGKWNSPSSDQA